MKKRFSNSLIVYVILIGACIFLFTSWPTSRGAVIYMAGEAAVFAPTDNRIAFVGRQGVQIWNGTMETMTLLTNYPRAHGGAIGWVEPLAWHPSGTFIALPGEYNQIEIWDVQRHEQITNLTGPSDNITALSFSPDGALLAAHSLDEHIRLWRWQDQALLWQRQASRDNTLIFSATGDKLITSGQMYHTRDGSIALNYYEIGNFASRCVAVLPQQNLIATCSTHGEVTIVDLKQRTILQTFQVLDGAAGSAALSPDGRFIAVGSGIFDGSEQASIAIQVVDRATGRKVWSLPRDRIAKVNQLHFSPDGRQLVAVMEDTILTFPYLASVYIWDSSTW